jgi:DNA repair exonuclease SbcCD ATPase subunit
LKTQINRLEEQVGLLEKQVDELEAQVDRLSSEVDRLENEVDRFSNETNKLSDINDELELNIANYTIQNILLNFSLATYAQLNEELNETVVLLEMQVDKLEDQVTLYEMLNDDLNETARELTLKVDDLASLNRQISETNGQLWIAIEQLSNETSELSVLNEELNNTVSELGNQIARMAAEIDRLENISLNLATLVGFINKTALEFDETFDAFSAKIAQQIDYNRALVIETLENLYKQRTAFWDCDFREYFLTEQFVQNRWVPIGKEMYPRVLAYIEERILSDLCLSTSNFEEFLGYEFVGSLDRRFNISFNELQRAVGLYTDNAENYFFPSGNATGVLPSTWAAADYKCANLPPDAMYLYHSSSPVKSNEYHS